MHVTMFGAFTSNKDSRTILSWWSFYKYFSIMIRILRAIGAVCKETEHLKRQNVSSHSDVFFWYCDKTQHHTTFISQNVTVTKRSCT